MVCLCFPNERVTTESAVMRKHAVDFCTDLFRPNSCDVDSVRELLKGLPQLSQENQDKISLDINLDELNSAVSQIASGKALGIDGLPSNFFKHFRSVLGHDPLDNFSQECCQDFYLQHDVNKCFKSQVSLFLSLCLSLHSYRRSLLSVDYHHTTPSYIYKL